MLINLDNKNTVNTLCVCTCDDNKAYFEANKLKYNSNGNVYDGIDLTGISYDISNVSKKTINIKPNSSIVLTNFEDDIRMLFLKSKDKLKYRYISKYTRNTHAINYKFKLNFTISNQNSTQSDVSGVFSIKNDFDLDSITWIIIVVDQQTYTSWLSNPYTWRDLSDSSISNEVNYPEFEVPFVAVYEQDTLGNKTINIEISKTVDFFVYNIKFDLSGADLSNMVITPNFIITGVMDGVLLSSSSQSFNIDIMNISGKFSTINAKKFLKMDQTLFLTSYDMPIENIEILNKNDKSANLEILGAETIGKDSNNISEGCGC